jgi:hypothetical protein
MSLIRISSTCCVVARRSAGSLLRRDLAAAGEGGGRRPNLLGPLGVALVVAALFVSLTTSSALAAGGLGYLDGSKQQKTSVGQTTVKRAKGKSGNEEVIIIGHSKGGKREEVVVSGPKGSIGHITATRGPDGGIGQVSVTGG